MIRAGGGAAASQAASIYSVVINQQGRQWTTYRTYQAGADSFFDAGVFALLTQFLLDYTRCGLITRATRLAENNPARISIENRIAPINPKFDRSGLTPIIWINILNIRFGFGPSNSPNTLRQAAVAHLLSRNQLNLLHPQAASLFPVIPIHPNQLIEALLHGDEKMVRDIINVAPELLLKKGTAIDFQGRSFTGTPLQAAIAADDIAPNTNSTGTVEIILEQLKQFKPDLYHAIFKEQAREIYEKSLRVYILMQEEIIVRLREFAGEPAENTAEQTDVNAKMRQAQDNLAAYAEALRSDDLNTLFETHKKAQADNAFDFKPYVDAILNAPQEQLNDVMAFINAGTEEETKSVIARTGVAARESDDCRHKAFDELTLVQKLNRFREKLSEHMQREIIFNPHHILTGLKANNAVWQRLPDTQDPNYHKRSVIFSQLCGFAQRLASEPVKQDIRQGTGYLTEKNECRTGQSRFNLLDTNYSVVKNSLVDVSFSSVVDGLGYKFAASTERACRPARGPASFGLVVFSKLMSNKNSSFQNLLRRERNQLTAA